jgi:hypothetical protein
MFAMQDPNFDERTTLVKRRIVLVLDMRDMRAIEKDH